MIFTPFTVRIKDAAGTYTATAKVGGRAYSASATAGAQQAAARLAEKVLGSQRFMAGHTVYRNDDPRNLCTIEIQPQ